MPLKKITLRRTSDSKSKYVFTGRASAVVEHSKDGTLLLSHFAMPAAMARGAVAMVRGSHEFTISCEGHGAAKRFDGGYKVHVGRLPRFNMAQVLVVANEPALMLGALHHALWRYISSDEITTPVVVDWVGPILEELQRGTYIRRTNSFGIEANVAEFSSEQLDQIVSRLVSKRRIRV